MSNGLAQELDRIAERVTALARIVTTLREENQALRIAVDQREGENRLLRDRLDTARDRVETLIARIPAES
jgi:predicted RNase H-like nuclease (RuvC/YqgF family)